MSPLKILILISFIGSIILAIYAGQALDPVLWALWTLGIPVALGGIIPGP
jgi:hypothetical protein